MVHFDFFYLHKTEEQKTKPVINGVDTTTSLIFSAAVMTKTPTEYLLKAILGYVEELGYNEVSLHSDQEQALVSILKEVQKQRKKTTRTRKGAKYGSQSQSYMEQANYEAEKQNRIHGSVNEGELQPRDELRE